MSKLYKRALSLLLTVIMILPSSAAVFADKASDYTMAETLLVGLNIVDKDEADVPVTRAKFADIFAKAMNIYDANYVPSNPFADTQDSDCYVAIEILHDRNYISGVGENNFAPGNLMRVEDIARLYVCALGLERYPESNNITFWTAANKLGLLKGVSYTGEITVHNLMIMTYNLLVEAPIGKISFSSVNSKSYTIDSSVNLLYQNFKVVKETGVISENSVSGIYSTSSVSKGYVKIKLNNGTVKVSVGNTDISNYLGYTVNAYIEYGDNDNRVICYEVNDNSDICIINISDISFSNSTLSQIVYNPNDGPTKRAFIASLPSVIYNGSRYNGTFNLNTLRDYDGTLTLIKSGSEDNYDIMNIIAYTDYFVSNVEYYDGEMRVFDKGRNNSLILNDNESEIKIYYPNGAEASIYELQANMLLTVMRSADLRNITIYICDDTKEESIAGIKTDERYIAIKDGEEYKVSTSYPIENIEIGKNVKLYFDYLGNVGWIETDANDGYSYAIVCSAKYKRKDDNVVIDTFIKAGEFTSFILAPKVRIDGVAYNNPQAQLDALDSIRVTGFEPGYYPMRYILNDEGQIKNIDTPTYNQGAESKDSLRMCQKPGEALYTSDGILGKKFVLSDSAKVFVLPYEPNLLENYVYYNAGGKSVLGKEGKKGNVMAFQTKEDSIYADLVIEWKKRWDYAPIDHDSQLFLIDKIVDVYDQTLEEVVKEIRGIEGGIEKAYRTHEGFDITELDGLGKGDVIRIAAFDGAIYNVQIVFQNDPTGATIGTYNRPDDSNAENNNEGNYDMYYCGYVRSREGKFLKILTADITTEGSNVSLPKPENVSWRIDNTSKEEYRVIQATNIAVYDPNLSRDESVYIGDMEDIPYYDGNRQTAVVIMRYRSRSPREIIVIKPKR